MIRAGGEADGMSDLRVVGSMHERKALMHELADAYIVLPGGGDGRFRDERLPRPRLPRWRYLSSGDGLDSVGLGDH